MTNFSFHTTKPSYLDDDLGASGKKARSDWATNEILKHLDAVEKLLADKPNAAIVRYRLMELVNGH